jgi:multiple sugar transport system substrate-binding protein
MKKQIKSLLCGLCAAALALGCGGCSGSAGSEVPAKVTDITVWTYYNGDQLESFNSLVNQFNETVGAQKGIKVSTESQGSVNDLETSVMDSAEGKVGAAAMPNIFSAYADTAYALDQMGMVVDLAPYLTEEEMAQFVEGYLSEGDFGEDDSIKIFPVAKSTELLFLNDTDWQAFADAAGVRCEDLATMEGLTAAAEKYYNWTDAQTAAPDDGKALFGRDAMANYMLVGAQQLGDTIFAVKDGRMTVNFERDVARRLWDNYYVPFVRGWFAATGRFRSDDIKTGNVLAYVGSSSSATFFPTRVTNDANESHEISLKTLPAPQFEGGEAVAVQQGAGMVVTAAKEEEVEASVEFLKWFVRAENNIAFSVGSGYLPVTRKANDMQEILAAADRETVVQRIAEGRSAAEAEAEFLTDEYFEAWYQDICAKLAQYEG